jgi:hypothetical protein
VSLAKRRSFALTFLSFPRAPGEYSPKDTGFTKQSGHQHGGGWLRPFAASTHPSIRPRAHDALHMNKLMGYWLVWRPDIIRWVAAILIFAAFAAFMLWSSKGLDYFDSFDPFG